jgi:hypothetical protein
MLILLLKGHQVLTHPKRGEKATYTNKDRDKIIFINFSKPGLPQRGIQTSR